MGRLQVWTPSTMSSSPARRRTLDFVRPEQSLAEWSSKIRELQAQVDHDEALEQQRLEEEIARSRLERARRRSTAGSTLGTSYRTCDAHGCSLDLHAISSGGIVSDEPQSAPRRPTTGCGPAATPLRRPSKTHRGYSSKDVDSTFEPSDSRRVPSTVHQSTTILTICCYF